MSSEQLLTEDLRLVEEVGLECVGERERERIKKTRNADHMGSNS